MPDYDPKKLYLIIKNITATDFAVNGGSGV